MNGRTKALSPVIRPHARYLKQRVRRLQQARRAPRDRLAVQRSSLAVCPNGVLSALLVRSKMHVEGWIPRHDTVPTMTPADAGMGSSHSRGQDWSGRPAGSYCSPESKLMRNRLRTSWISTWSLTQALCRPDGDFG
ncbi:hypothetical protein CKAH01_05078 [Colletotrichum kahawae]|uniref:Uncharacterized protein n=1 Tax=Colletotrichum kahawae TaxID=34407 RepID=A0AAD9YFR0_COLKA|nr:hypothetical protein CKAH01_05078 [Colletotrichum kahawae]